MSDDLHLEPPDPDEDDLPDTGPALPDHELRRRLHRLTVKARPLGPIRELLQPLYHGWYRECAQCGELVGADGEPYYVERAIRRGEPIFEYALCESCVYSFQDDLSAESLVKLGDYWLREFDADERDRRLETGLDPTPLVETCILTHTPRSELEEFQVWAWIRNGQLEVDESTPALVGGAVLEEMADLLSKQTRDRLEDFVRDHLGLPPELQKLPIMI